MLQGVLEIAEDTGMREALEAAGLDVEQLKREAQEKLVGIFCKYTILSHVASTHRGV